MTPLTRKNRAPRVKIHEITAENDIGYRGPLTFQHFQLLGWLCIVASQGLLLLRLGRKMDPSVGALFDSVGPVLDALANVSLPLLLLANFAQILDTSDGYKQQLLKNLGASLGVFLFSVFFFERYIVNGFAALSTEPADAKPALEAMLFALSPTGFFSFNFFIDLFLCTLVMLFLNYRPKKLFRGKLLHIFRLFALLPIGYEIGCMVLKVLCARRQIVLPLWSFPLLTVKPPMTFVLFTILALFVKVRELRFRRHGKTHEDYQEFLKTNKNSLNFSIFLAVMMVVVSLLDFLFLTGYGIISTVVSLDENGVINEMAETPPPSPASQELLEQSLKETETGTPTAAESASPDQEVPLSTETIGEEEALQMFFAALQEKAAENTLPDAEGAAPEPLTEEELAQKKAEQFTETLETTIQKEISTAEALGFGGSISMLLLAPLVLLFSYTKTPRSTIVGMAIPAVGVVLIIFMYLEAIRMALWSLPIPKMDLNNLTYLIWSIMSSLR